MRGKRYRDYLQALVLGNCETEKPLVHLEIGISDKLFGKRESAIALPPSSTATTCIFFVSSIECSDLEIVDSTKTRVSQLGIITAPSGIGSRDCFGEDSVTLFFSQHMLFSLSHARPEQEKEGNPHGGVWKLYKAQAFKQSPSEDVLRRACKSKIVG